MVLMLNGYSDLLNLGTIVGVTLDLVSRHSSKCLNLGQDYIIWTLWGLMLST